MELDLIGTYHGTDKSSIKHNYLKIYEQYLEPYRNIPSVISEIGVFKGASLKTWKEYFHKSQIYGFDIQNKKEYEEDRITTIQGNQRNTDDLAKIPHSDIIIDDGSHQIPDMLASFDYLYFNRLKYGGFYIIEDLHATYMEKARGNIRKDFEKLIVNLAVMCDKTTKVKSIHMHKNIIIIEK